jgi:acyl-CoA dehydrogenase
MMCKRLISRAAFGKPIADQGVMVERIANSRIQIDQVRLLVLHAAWKMDMVGNKESRREIAGIKVAAANMACEVVDRAIQAFGGAGVSDDFGLAYMYKTARTLRIVDGPDEVHRHQLGRTELAKYKNRPAHD